MTIPKLVNGYGRLIAAGMVLGTAAGEVEWLRTLRAKEKEGCTITRTEKVVNGHIFRVGGMAAGFWAAAAFPVTLYFACKKVRWVRSDPRNGPP